MKDKSSLLYISLLLPFLSVVFALLVGGVMIYLAGADPVFSYVVLFRGAFGSLRGITDSVVKAIPLVFTGLAFAFAAKCSVWNIGAEGQLYVGAVTTMVVGIYLKGLPPLMHIGIALLVGALSGGLWAGIAAILKIKRNVSEVINTIMLNYIAVLFASFLVFGPMIEDRGRSPQTRQLLESAQLPILIRGTRLHAGIIIAVVACVIVYIVFNHTVFGYRLKAVGFNREAARFAGIKVNRYVFLSLVISGMFAGLAGSIEMMGFSKRMIIGFSPGYGFEGIAVALLGQLNPFGIILAAFLLGALRIGANAMQRGANVPVQIVSIIQAVIILSVIASGAFIQAMKNKRRKEGKTNG